MLFHNSVHYGCHTLPTDHHWLLVTNLKLEKSSMEHIPRAVAVAQLVQTRAGLNVASYVHACSEEKSGML